MSIESKEIKDIYALYQSLSERTYAEVKAEREERIKNIKDPFRKTTIGTEDGKELKKGDPGFEDALKNARKTVRDDNNKSLGKDNNSSSSSSTSSNAKGNPIGGDDERGPKGNPIGSSDEKKPTASGSVKFSGSQLKGLLDSQKGIGKKEKEYGGTGTKTVLNKDGSKTTTTGHSDDLRSDTFGGTKASSEKGKKILNPDEKSKVITKGGPDRSGTQSSQKDKVITKGGPDRSGTQSSTAEKSKPQLSGHAKRSAQKIEKRRVEKIKANQPAPTEKDLEDAKKEADTANIMKLSGKYKEVPAPGPGNDGKTVLQKVKNPNPKDNKLDPTPIKKPVEKPVAKPEISARQKWLDKTKNSPAAKGGLSDDQRWAARQKHVKFQKDNNRGEFAKPAGGGAPQKQSFGQRQIAKAKMRGNPAAQAKAKMQSGTPTNKLFNSYDPYDLVLNYLLETNQVDTIEEANYVMVQMDESTIQGIVNEYA